MDEILDIADDMTNDCFTNENGKTVLNNTAINRARLQIDTRKWLACKLVPRVYGPKNNAQQHEYTSEEEEAIRKEIMELRTKLALKYRRDY